MSCLLHFHSHDRLLRSQVAERIAQLQEALLHCGKFQDALEPLLSWLSDTEELVANQKPPSAEYRVVKAQIQEQKVQEGKWSFSIEGIETEAFDRNSDHRFCFCLSTKMVSCSTLCICFSVIVFNKRVTESHVLGVLSSQTIDVWTTGRHGQWSVCPAPKQPQLTVCQHKDTHTRWILFLDTHTLFPVYRTYTSCVCAHKEPWSHVFIFVTEIGVTAWLKTRVNGGAEEGELGQMMCEVKNKLLLLNHTSQHNMSATLRALMMH